LPEQILSKILSNLDTTEPSFSTCGIL